MFLLIIIVLISKLKISKNKRKIVVEIGFLFCFFAVWQRLTQHRCVFGCVYEYWLSADQNLIVHRNMCKIEICSNCAKYLVLFLRRGTLNNLF